MKPKQFIDQSNRKGLNFHLLVKPSGARCNLSCKYCFFLSKENLYEPNESAMMNEAMLELYIKELFETSGSEVQIAWQGGEPMLRGLAFFKKSIELAKHYCRPQQHITYTIQTNGTLIDDAWAKFFRKHHFLVGISIDGPRHLHNIYRIGKDGKGSFDRVIRGWGYLKKYGVDVNILCAIHSGNVEYPLQVYRFFRDELKARYIQFIPIVERATESTLEFANQGWGGVNGKDRPLYKQEGSLVTERTVKADKFGEFLCTIFDEWILHDVGNIFVTTFDVALGSWLGQHNACTNAPTCGKALVLEHNGDLYCCDHFVEPRYYLGNIKETALRELISSEKQRCFGENKYNTLPQYCIDCPVVFACYGECPRNRFIKTPTGEEGLNYLCLGYRKFYMHINGAMKIMSELLRQGRFPDEIMQMK